MINFTPRKLSESTTILMPLVVSEDEKVRNFRKSKYHETWIKNYTGEIPVIILAMRRCDEKTFTQELTELTKISNTKVYYLDKTLSPVGYARAVLEHLAECEGFEFTIQIDDDFSVKPEYGKNLQLLLDTKIIHPYAWLHGTKRMIFTTKKNSPVTLDYLEYVTETQKFIPNGSRIWEKRAKGGWDVGYWFNTREGILSPIGEYFTSLKTIKDLTEKGTIPKKIWEYNLAKGEDVINLISMSYLHGIEVHRVFGVWHEQCIDQGKNGLNHSLVRDAKKEFCKIDKTPEELYFLFIEGYKKILPNVQKFTV